MMKTQRLAMSSLRSTQKGLEKKNARQNLKEQRGFGSGKDSTFTNDKMLRKMWENAKTVNGIVADNLGKKVVFDSTIQKKYANIMAPAKV